MNKRYLVALDQGTTSGRAVVFTVEGAVVSQSTREFKQHYPQAGWVEHDPADILSSQIESLRTAVRQAGIRPDEIAAIGITNQRETTLLWDRKTGVCVHNAIVWQCRRTAPLVEKLVREGHSDMIRQKTGLIPDAYFSGTKLQWLLHLPGVMARAQRGELCFGTVDSFLAWHLVKGHPHVTDATNAARTMLFNLHTQHWDDHLRKLMDVPLDVLPRVVDSSGVIGMLDESILGAEIPVSAMAGDQHAALFGQACFAQGMVKNTYGTGCFMLMNIGDTFRVSEHGLLTTMAWRIGGKPTYALEGSVFMGGATVQWLRDELHIIDSAADSAELAQDAPDNQGVYLVPAFTGLGAPYWDMYARGTLVGVTRGTNRAVLARAVLEAIAYQSNDLLRAMQKDGGAPVTALRADGGASNNALLMQFQADIMGIPVLRPAVMETTALGAALMAGLGVGLFDDLEQTSRSWHVEQTFTPEMNDEKRADLLHGWKRAVDTALFWAEYDKRS